MVVALMCRVESVVVAAAFITARDEVTAVETVQVMRGSRRSVDVLMVMVVGTARRRPDAEKQKQRDTPSESHVDLRGGTNRGWG